MQELKPTTTIKSTKNNLLNGTKWRCTSELEEGIEYHEIRFVSPNKVEGWSKDRAKNQAEQMFIANYVLTGETLRIEQDQKNFQAVLVHKKIIAFVDDKKMVFHLAV